MTRSNIDSMRMLISLCCTRVICVFRIHLNGRRVFDMRVLLFFLYWFKRRYAATQPIYLIHSVALSSACAVQIRVQICSVHNRSLRPFPMESNKNLSQSLRTDQIYSVVCVQFVYNNPTALFVLLLWGHSMNVRCVNVCVKYCRAHHQMHKTTGDWIQERSRNEQHTSCMRNDAWCALC